MAIKDITDNFFLNTAIGSSLIEDRKIKLLHNIELDGSIYKYNNDRLVIDIPAHVVDHFYSFYITCSYAYKNGIKKDYGYLSLKYNSNTNSYRGAITDFEFSKCKDTLKEITFSFMGEDKLKENMQPSNTYFKMLSYSL